MDEVAKFLNAIVRQGGESTPAKLHICCGREQDKARQRAKRLGLVTFAKNPSRWIITQAGREALAAQTKE